MNDNARSEHRQHLSLNYCVKSFMTLKLFVKSNIHPDIDYYIRPYVRIRLLYLYFFILSKTD